MKSIVFGSQSIALGHSNLVVTGGFESMSNIPFYVTGVRFNLNQAFINYHNLTAQKRNSLWKLNIT